MAIQTIHLPQRPRRRPTRRRLLGEVLDDLPLPIRQADIRHRVALLTRREELDPIVPVHVPVDAGPYPKPRTTVADVQLEGGDGLGALLVFRVFPDFADDVSAEAPGRVTLLAGV